MYQYLLDPRFIVSCIPLCIIVVVFVISRHTRKIEMEERKRISRRIVGRQFNSQSNIIHMTKCNDGSYKANL